MRHVMRTAIRVVSLLGAVHMAACGGEDSSSPSREGPASRIAQADLDVILGTSNDFVTERIIDGVVTAEEYESAVFRTIQCYDENGVQHSTPFYREERFGSGSWEYTYQQNPGTESARVECFESFEYPVLLVWIEQFRRTEQQQQVVDDDLVECANDAGIDGRTRSEIELLVDSGSISPDLMQEYVRCLVLAEDGYDINDPPPQP